MSPDSSGTTSAVIFLSGGKGSWASGRRYIDTNGPDGVVALFTDVGDSKSPYVGEHEDTYRFLNDAVANLGVPLIRLQDGRNIWDVFDDKQWLGNSGLSHCSWELKTKPALAWCEANRDPANTVLIVGIDYLEGDRRLPAITRNWAPFRVAAPLCDPPAVGKDGVARMLRDNGLRPPDLTDRYGFAHANCIGCVKGGQGHWKRVLDTFPGHYAYAEGREQEFRDKHQADVSILKDRMGGTAVPLTLRRFREEQQAGGAQLDLFDIGGCGCFVDEATA